MGLSATQTRFLMVTARKSNVEYQGQQINQARTALANQSSQLYTEMMSLNAPTAPSPYEYVMNPASNPNINWKQETPYPLSGAAAKNFEIYYAGNEPQFQDFNIDEYVYRENVSVENKDKTTSTVSGWCKKSKDENGNVVYGSPIANKNDIPGTYCILTEGKNSAGQPINYYEINIPASAGFTYDISTGMFGKTIDNKFVTDPETVKLPVWAQAYNNARSINDIYSKPSKATIYAKDADLSGLETNHTTDDPDVISYSRTSTMSVNQAQYNAAYAQYEKDLAEYEKACEDINSKTEEIHQADKKLELQLKQLDTERTAIDTEYEALKKVLTKNIENTYKTFNG